MYFFPTQHFSVDWSALFCGLHRDGKAVEFKAFILGQIIYYYYMCVGGEWGWELVITFSYNSQMLHHIFIEPSLICDKRIMTPPPLHTHTHATRAYTTYTQPFTFTILPILSQTDGNLTYGYKTKRTVSFFCR